VTCCIRRRSWAPSAFARLSVIASRARLRIFIVSRRPNREETTSRSGLALAIRRTRRSASRHPTTFGGPRLGVEHSTVGAGTRIQHDVAEAGEDHWPWPAWPPRCRRRLGPLGMTHTHTGQAGALHDSTFLGHAGRRRRTCNRVRVASAYLHHLVVAGGPGSRRDDLAPQSPFEVRRRGTSSVLHQTATGRRLACPATSVPHRSAPRARSRRCDAHPPRHLTHSAKSAGAASIRSSTLIVSPPSVGRSLTHWNRSTRSISPRRSLSSLPLVGAH